VTTPLESATAPGSLRRLVLRECVELGEVVNVLGTVLVSGPEAALLFR
jgi:hypothetical protein